MTPLRVLIIDDSVTIRAMLEQVISGDSGCTVVGVAADIGSAWALMRTTRPDAITLDLAMPGVDGLRFLRALKGQRHPPIIVVSSNTSDGSWEGVEALAAGAAACFDKAKLLSHAPQFMRVLKKSARAQQSPPPPPQDPAALVRVNRNEGSGNSMTMDRAVLYVSRQAFAAHDREREIASILVGTRARNAQRGITGALLCTRDHFAQLLEGPKTELDEVMRRIEQDDRHTDLIVLYETAIARRQLPHWSMAYSGPSSYVARQIEPLFSGRDGLHPHIGRLQSLLIGLATIDAE